MLRHILLIVTYFKPWQTAEKQKQKNNSIAKTVTRVKSCNQGEKTYDYNNINNNRTPSKLKCGVPIWEHCEQYWYFLLNIFVFPKGLGQL